MQFSHFLGMFFENISPLNLNMSHVLQIDQTEDKVSSVELCWVGYSSTHWSSLSSADMGWSPNPQQPVFGVGETIKSHALFMVGPAPSRCHKLGLVPVFYWTCRQKKSREESCEVWKLGYPYQQRSQWASTSLFHLVGSRQQGQSPSPAHGHFLLSQSVCCEG